MIQRERRCVVYCVQASLGPVKVGRTDSLHERIISFRGAAPCPIKLLGATPGGWFLEGRMKAVLEPDCCHGEWFTPTLKVLRLVDTVLQGGAPAVLSLGELALDSFHIGHAARDALRVSLKRLKSWVSDGLPDDRLGEVLAALKKYRLPTAYTRAAVHPEIMHLLAEDREAA